MFLLYYGVLGYLLAGVVLVVCDMARILVPTGCSLCKSRREQREPICGMHYMAAMVCSSNWGVYVAS